jgi:predicted phage tail protein
MQLKTIKVYGNLRKFLGRSTFQAAVNSPQQAYSFLKANFVANNIVPLVTTFVTGGLSSLLTVAALTLASDLLTPDLPTNNVSSVGDTDPNIRGSYTFTGIQNVSSSGVPIPILYGYVYSGSILISSGVDNAQLVAMLSSTMTYTQSGNTITVTANGHSFRNGENIDVNFISGPLANHPSLDPCTFGVENVTANTFQMSTGTWNSQTYSNAGNVLEVTMRNKP